MRVDAGDFKEDAMSAPALVPDGSTELERKIEQHITQQTWGRVHQLQVARLTDRLVIHGYTSSYYIKQLAIRAVCEALGPEQSLQVAVDIHVGNDSPIHTQGRDHVTA
jgi:hypothetical protein